MISSLAQKILLPIGIGTPSTPIGDAAVLRTQSCSWNQAPKGTAGSSTPHLDDIPDLNRGKANDAPPGSQWGGSSALNSRSAELSMSFHLWIGPGPQEERVVACYSPWRRNMGGAPSSAPPHVLRAQGEVGAQSTENLWSGVRTVGRLWGISLEEQSASSANSTRTISGRW